MPEVSCPATRWSSISDAAVRRGGLGDESGGCEVWRDWVRRAKTTGWVVGVLDVSFSFSSFSLGVWAGSEWRERSAASHIARHHLSISPPTRCFGSCILNVLNMSSQCCRYRASFIKSVPLGKPNRYAEVKSMPTPCMKSSTSSSPPLLSITSAMIGRKRWYIK